MNNLKQWIFKNWRVSLPLLLVIFAIGNCTSRRDHNKIESEKQETISAISSKTGMDAAEVEALFKRNPNSNELEALVTECKKAKAKDGVKTCGQWFDDIKKPAIEKAEKMAKAAERKNQPGAAEFSCSEDGSNSGYQWYLMYSDRAGIDEFFGFYGDELRSRLSLRSPNVFDGKYEYPCHDVAYNEGSSCETVSVYRDTLAVTETRLNAANIQKYAGKNSFGHFSCQKMSDSDADSVVERFQTAKKQKEEQEEQERREQTTKNKY
jgi:hypothetical protein